MTSVSITEQLTTVTVDNSTIVDVVSDAVSVVEASSGLAIWGNIIGALSDQIDLVAALAVASGVAVWGGIGGALADQTDLQTALNNLVPYTGANANVDLGAYSIASSNFLLNDLTGTSVAGGLISDAGNGVNLYHAGYGNFVGFNSLTGSSYFGSDPNLSGYGVQYADNILYVNANTGFGDAGALTLNVNGGSIFAGDSANFNATVSVYDYCLFDDGTTDSFTVQLPNLGYVPIGVPNNGSVLLCSSKAGFYESGFGYLASGNAGWDAAGGFSAGISYPLYSQLESTSSARTQLRLAYSNTVYNVFNVDVNSGLAIQGTSLNTAAFSIKNPSSSTLFNIDTTNNKITHTLASNVFLLATGGSNTSPNLSIGASGGKAILLGASSGLTYAVFDSTSNFNITTDTRANIVAGTNSGGTATRVYIVGTGSNVMGIGTACLDTLTVGSGSVGTNISFGLRTLTSGGSSIRSIFTQNAATGVLDLVVDQGQSGSARALNLSVGAATNALSISSVGALTIIAGQSIGSSTATQIYNASSATTVIDYNINASSTANNTFIRLINGTISTASSGVSNIVSSTPSINQSGTAGYNAIHVNVTETTTGSGAKNLALFAIGSAERFSVNNVGFATHTTAVAGGDIFKIANSDATTGNGYTFKILNSGITKGLRIDGGGSSNDSVSFEDSFHVNMGTATGVGIGTTTTTASWLTIAAGTTAKASANIIAGTYKTTPLAGDIDYNGTNIRHTNNANSAFLARIITTTATLDFPSIATNAAAELTMTVTGAATGDTVAIAPPSGLEAGLTPSARVSAADTVTVRLHNSSGGAVDPASATWRATVIKF